MRRLVRTLSLLVLAGVLVVAAAYGATHRHAHAKHDRIARDPGRLGPRLFGFNDNSVLFGQTDPETAIARSAAAGANIVRYTVDWDYVEPQQGQFNWHGYDPLYRAAIAHGIRPVLVPAFGPGWTRPLDLSCGAANIAHCHNPPDAKYDGAWVAFVQALVKRYPKAAAIEMWNEPNLSIFWKAGPDPARYAQLLDLAYDAVKQVNPSMPVLGGALANSEFGGDGSTPYEQYVDGLLALKPKLDGLAIHDYENGGTDADWFQKTLSIARDALDSNGYRSTPLWVTEVGSTTGGDDPVSTRQQATQLVSDLATLGARRDVKAALVHTLIPAPVQPGTQEWGYSTLNSDGSPKPAYCALARGRRVRLPSGCGG